MGDREIQEVAHRGCVVPGPAAQRLILLIHAARDQESARGDDIEVPWNLAMVEEQREVNVLAQELRAEVALSAATGQLEDYRECPEYDLWRLYRDGRTTTGLRRMRVEAKAAPDGLGWPRLRVLAYAVQMVVLLPSRLAAASRRRIGRKDLRDGYRAIWQRAVEHRAKI